MSTATPLGWLSVVELVLDTEPLPLASTMTTRLLPVSAINTSPTLSTATPVGVFRGVPRPVMLRTEPADPPAATVTIRLFTESAI